MGNIYDGAFRTIMKVQEYSLGEIFEKRLLMLLPFYIFSHEKNFEVYNSSSQRLAELEAEYQEILERLEELEMQGVIDPLDKRTIIELSRDVIREITKKFENVQEGVGKLMRGALIETEARKIFNQGISQGIDETKKKTAMRMLVAKKLTIEEIAEYSGLSVEEVERLAGLQTV